MNIRRISTRLAAVLVALAAAFVIASPATSARSAHPAIFWIDLSGTAQQHPDFIFFQANSGSQVEKIKWNGWGKNRTVGRGHYYVSSPPPPGEKNPAGPARIVAWKPVLCVPEFGNRKGKMVLVYRHAKLLRPVRGGGRKWTDISAFTGYLTCK